MKGAWKKDAEASFFSRTFHPYLARCLCYADFHWPKFFAAGGSFGDFHWSKNLIWAGCETLWNFELWNFVKPLLVKLCETPACEILWNLVMCGFIKFFYFLFCVYKKKTEHSNLPYKRWEKNIKKKSPVIRLVAPYSKNYFDLLTYSSDRGGPATFLTRTAGKGSILGVSFW